jgi:UDP-glucuronate 4-epimerase
MQALVTGCAGFIGHHLSLHLLDTGWEIIGIDNMDPYYDVRIKEGNLDKLKDYRNFTFHRFDINDAGKLESKLNDKPDIIVHLAAKAGVRTSFEKPVEYAKVNINGTIELLQFTKRNKIDKFIFASSSSVYGESNKLPYSEEDGTICPVSPYGMTKYHGEKICELYSELYGLNVNALRFFTVYGPGQRPDMAINKFIKSILKGEQIEMFGEGDMFRDYTYYEDIVSGVVESMNYFNGFNIFNLGNGNPIMLKDMISIIGDQIGNDPDIKIVPAPRGEMQGTFADITKAKELLKYEPRTSFSSGIISEIEWLKKSKF